MPHVSHQRRVHYLYRLVHPVSGEFYVGVRSCDCRPEEDRKYRGSGRWPKLCSWDGITLTKEVLAEFSSRSEAEEAEVLLIDLALPDSLCRNGFATASAAFKEEIGRNKHGQLAKRWNW
jgi:hypothetical protein